MRQKPLIVLMLTAAFAIGALFLVALETAHAHHLEPSGPDGVMRTWHLDPLLISLVALTAVVYVTGFARVRARSGRGPVGKTWQGAAFFGGLSFVLVALTSPLDAAALELLSLHMAQHLVLVSMAAPLLVLGAPGIHLLVGVPRRLRRWAVSAGRSAPARAAGPVITHPLSALMIASVMLWAWHAPPLYEAALAGSMVHHLEHATLLGSSLLFWWVIVRSLGRPVGIPYVFAAAVQGSVLGALLTFSGSSWYSSYEHTAPLWGMTALEDQQLAGVIMWVPAGLVYVAAAAALFAAWLLEEERRQQRREDLATTRQGI